MTVISQAAPLPSPRPSPPSSSWALLALAFALASSSALAQAGVCKAGANCDVQKLTSRSTTTLAGGCFVSTTSTNSIACATSTGTNIALTLGTNSIIDASQGFISLGDGSAAAPQFRFQADTNTGLYRPGADEIGFAANGLRTFRMTGSGIMYGTANQPSLTLNTSAGAMLDYNGTANVTVATSTVSVNAGSGFIDALSSIKRSTASRGVTIEDPEGLEIIGVAQLSLSTISNWLVQRDTNTNGLWKKPTTPSATAPMVDLGGGAHPVLERRTWGVDFGYESTSTPTFYPVAPRIGASAATVTMSETGNTGTTCGATPNIIPCRGTTTAASSGSVASMVTSAFIRNAGMSPRWCQRVSLSTGSNIRAWVGMANALPGSSDNPANGAVSFRYSTTAGDSKWQACYANGVSTTCSDTTVAPSTSSATYDTLCIDCREGMSTACVWWVNGVARVRVTSGLPTGSPFFPYFSVEARSAAAVTGYEGAMAVEMN